MSLLRMRALSVMGTAIAGSVVVALAMPQTAIAAEPSPGVSESSSSTSLAPSASDSVSAEPSTSASPELAASASASTASASTATASESAPAPRRMQPGLFDAKVWPKTGTYGVGIIPYVTFSKDVPKNLRKRVETNLEIVTGSANATKNKTPEPVVGSWRWVTKKMVMFRPDTLFWPAYTTVRVAANLSDMNNPGKPVQFARHTVAKRFVVGRSSVININSKTDRGTLVVDGKRVHKFLTSTGKAGYLTRSGIKTLMDKHRIRKMTNVGVTTEEVYSLMVPYAMRLTLSGEYLHAAPWNWQIGKANTSHGCTHLTMKEARYIFSHMKFGDPVITTGTRRGTKPGNGNGTYWNIKYKLWAS